MYFMNIDFTICHKALKSSLVKKYCEKRYEATGR